MIPSRQEAERLLTEAESCNPGPWGNHSRVAAHCAEKIAEACEGMDPEKAYVLGLLHDIGRKFGVRHLGHVSDGYSWMMSLGYDEAARICLTHSFNNYEVDEYIGKFDTTNEELELIRSGLRKVVPDDYDRLIQLCDALAGSEGVMNIEDRMNDVRRRYGRFPQPKWDSNLALKAYFEEKARKSIYDLVEKDTFRLPGNERIMSLPLLYRAARQGRFGTRTEFSRGSVTDALFVYLDGEPEPASAAEADARYRVRPLVCLTEAWKAHIEARYPGVKVYRRTQMKPASRFILPENPTVPESFRLAGMDEAAFGKHPFSHGINYPSWEVFRAEGSGAVVYRGEEIVAAASSFLSLDGELELDVSTAEGCRGMRLASACVSLMLRDCAERGFTVHWDAQNDISLHLALKFGFDPETEYPVYWLSEKD